MTTPQKRLQDLQARAINERIIEYGLRRGLLDALRLSYEPARDGSLVVYVPRHRGQWRIQPPGVGESSTIRVIASGDDGRVEMGVVTPPVGLNLFAVCSTSRIPLPQVVKGTIPFFIADLVVLLLIIFVPELATWLPDKVVTDAFKQ